MPNLFDPISFRDLTIRNRIFVSPMCQYSSNDGMPTDWHLVHLGSRAVGGAGLVMVEATAISPEGRISLTDSGTWSDAHAAAFARITRFLLDHGATPAIQLAHAGRKASTAAPWSGGGPVPPQQGGWHPLAPSPIPFNEAYPTPHEMTQPDLDKVRDDFISATRRSESAGFKAIEIHMAHGYLLHEFLSPLSNQRQDQFGGPLENRMRFPLQVARAVRESWPQNLPVFVRISATDWAEGGWDLPQSIQLSIELKKIGVDLIDCSTGGLLPHAKVLLGPGYQVPFAAAIRKEAQIATGAVGLITDPHQADQIIASGQADAILLARAMLRDPYWSLHAAKTLGVPLPYAPVQYGRA